MHRFNIAFLGMAITVGFQAAVVAQEPEKKLPDPAHGYQWKEAAQKTGELGAKEIEQLARDKILVTNRAYKQVFTPYLADDLPLFLTSDSLLNGFHVLYEESIYRLEQANARKLGRILKFIWQNLQTADKAFTGKPKLVAAANARAKLTIATAMQLLGEQPIPLEPSVAALVKEEVQRVESARGRQKPKWLGPPDPGFIALDYTRYRPRGFYTRTPALQRYFRAASWLQSIPFRVSKDEELVTILMLGNCVSYDRLREASLREQDLREFFGAFEIFVGPGDDWNLMAAAHLAQGEIRLDEALAREREYLLQQATGEGKGPQINDQLAFAPDDPTQAAEVSFRIIPAYRTPDAVLFQRTTDLRKFQRDFPNGLEVCATLGSSYARSRLAGCENGKLLVQIDRCKALFSAGSLYCNYLRCLDALLAAPEPGAPAFMSNEAWQIKSCQTALSGWAQLRHTWALQAKQSVMYASIDEEIPSGFVEPSPEFFARLAKLVEDTEAALKRTGALTIDPRDTAADLRDGIALLEKLDASRKKAGKERAASFNKLSVQEEMLLRRICALLRAMNKEDELGEKDFGKAIGKLRKLADDLERDPTPEELALAKRLCAWDVNLDEQWHTLGMLCRRLESLAHKQLRGVAFSDEENRFIRTYGEELAAVMLYGGNSYCTPNDDAPRVVDVFSNPNVGGHLEVGIARPQALYILYPIKGGEVLCRGAVMPYYEFVHDARLTDVEWKSLLDSDKRPKSPDWITPIIASGGPPTVKPEVNE
jgi:hypothetical protein